MPPGFSYSTPATGLLSPVGCGDVVGLHDGPAASRHTTTERARTRTDIAAMPNRSLQCLGWFHGPLVCRRRAVAHACPIHGKGRPVPSLRRAEPAGASHPSIAALL